MRESYMTYHDKLPEWAKPCTTRDAAKSGLRLKIEAMNIRDEIYISFPKAKRNSVTARAHQLAASLGFKCSVRSYTSSDGANVCAVITRVR